MLIVHGPFFYGVMEGSRHPVFKRMEVVITDDRHRDLQVLSEEPITEPRFVNWSFSTLPDTSMRVPDQAPLAGFILDLSRRLG